LRRAGPVAARGRRQAEAGREGGRTGRLPPALRPRRLLRRVRGLPRHAARRAGRLAEPEGSAPVAGGGGVRPGAQERVPRMKSPFVVMAVSGLVLAAAPGPAPGGGSGGAGEPPQFNWDAGFTPAPRYDAWRIVGPG